MKKLVVFVVLMAMLIGLAPAVHAAGSASVTGPSTVRAGDTITVSFHAGGGIYGGQGSLSYDTALLTLSSCNATVGGSWAVEFSGSNFVFYDNTMANPIKGSTTIFTATFTVSKSAAPGTKISVTASGVTLSDGDQDLGAGSPSWSATIAPPLSTNCKLASLSVSGVSISPAFSADVTSYRASVPFTTSSVQVSAKAADQKAKVSVSNTQLVAGGTTTVKVTVTAESGATKTYTISIARAQDPNYVPSSNNKLSSLTVEGEPLSPVFSADVLRYYIWLPYEAETVTISGTAEDAKASVTVGPVPALEPGKAVDVPVTVTAEDKTEKVYTVTVFRAPAHEDTDRFLQGERAEETEPVTEPETTVPATTEPAPTQVVEDDADNGSISWIIPAVIALLAGGGIGVAAAWLILKRKMGNMLQNDSEE